MSPYKSSNKLIMLTIIVIVMLMLLSYKWTSKIETKQDASIFDNK